MISTISTNRLCIYALGIALFVVFSLCLQIPVFENYYLCLGYVVMAVYCWFYGPSGGMITGFLGVVLYCLLTDGLRGMPGWAMGNLVIGLMMGMVFRRIKHWKSAVLRWAVCVIATASSTAAGILVLKSGVEFILYGQPFMFRMMKNSYAFIADVFLLLFSFPICAQLERFFPSHQRG